MSSRFDGGACSPQTRRLRRLTWSVAALWLQLPSSSCSEEPASAEPSASAASEAPATAAAPAQGAVDAGREVDAAVPHGLDAAQSPPSEAAPRAGTASTAADAPAAGAPAAGAPATDASAATDAGSAVDPPTSGADAATTPAICSGCAGEPTNPMDMTIHLHHVHLRVADRSRSGSFYEGHLGAQRVTLNATDDAWHAPPILLLLDETPIAPASSLPAALQHIGWGSADPAAWYEAAHAAGVAPDTRGNTLFNTNETPTIGEPGSGASTFELLGAQPPACFPIPDAFSYIYVLGPDGERVEVWSGADLRVNHLHFTTPDLAATLAWYQRFLNLPAAAGGLLYSALFLDDILLFFEPIGQAADYGPSEEHVLSHVAFSVTDLEAWRARASEQAVEIVTPPAPSYGFDSFFVRGPDGVLVELVQAAASAELCP